MSHRQKAENALQRISDQNGDPQTAALVAIAHALCAIAGWDEPEQPLNVTAATRDVTAPLPRHNTPPVHQPIRLPTVRLCPHGIWPVEVCAQCTPGGVIN